MAEARHGAKEVDSNGILDFESVREQVRILHVLASSPYGGLESVVRSLTHGLIRHGHDCRVIAIVDDEPNRHPFVAELERLEVPVVTLQVAGRAYLRERRELI